MTRVSDALARAAGKTVPSPSPGEVELPLEVPAELWPSEATSDDPAEQFMESQNPARSAASTTSRPEFAPLDRNEKLVTALSLPPGSVEQYRRLAARLHLSQAERGFRTVMVTSAVVGEGKTLTATNLALTLSESYKRRVLLIDADLRRPWVHELLQLPNVTGLNDGIRADVDRKVPLITVSKYLSVLTAGRPDPDPMSVLSSDRMRRVLADASRSFDWVIIDTPPVGLLSDAHLLATLVDTVILVVKAGTTPLRTMRQSVEAVGRDRILGVVLNRAEDVGIGSYSYYGYGAGRSSGIETVEPRANSYSA